MVVDNQYSASLLGACVRAPMCLGPVGPHSVSHSAALSARVRAEAAYDDDDDCAPCSDEDEDGGWSSAGSSYGGRSRSTTFGRSPPHRCVNVVPHPLAHSQLSEEAELQLALALSLSASMGDAAGTPGRSRGEGDAHRLPPRPPRRRGGIGAGVDAELTYETLVQLEDVKLTASQACVDALPVLAFDPRDAHGDAGACCSICLELYSEGDSLLKLPCGHVMHNAPCGREYLLNWSKKCPECKRSATGE